LTPWSDPTRVAMWGHSMGGGATTKAMVIDPRIRAAILYAPVSADDTEVLERWGARNDHNPDPELARIYREVSRDPEFLRLTSPINYLHDVSAAVQIHQGASDRTTPPRWAEAIRDGLVAAGKPVEYFAYPRQGHALEGEAWNLFMERLVAFLAVSLAPVPNP
jgi:dipeptidyl aminopeptidase/acylaminoacyl peptidase